MNTRKEETKPQHDAERGSGGAELAGDSPAPASRKLTVAENVIVTIKILVGFALFGGAIWVFEVMTSN